MPIDPAQLAQFTGTSGWHRFSQLFPRLLLTDGAKYIAENAGSAGAYWLMDAIGSYQPQLLKKQPFRNAQFWKLEVRPDKTARLTCVKDSDMPPEVEQFIEYTDFDMPECRLYCMPVDANGNYTVLLPSEY